MRGRGWYAVSVEDALPNTKQRTWSRNKRNTVVEKKKAHGILSRLGSRKPANMHHPCAFATVNKQSQAVVKTKEELTSTLSRKHQGVVKENGVGSEFKVDSSE